MEERIPPSHRNTGFRIENVLVNKTENVVDIEFNPFSCQSKEETFDLLGIAGAKIEEMESASTGFKYENEKGHGNVTRQNFDSIHLCALCIETKPYKLTSKIILI